MKDYDGFEATGELQASVNRDLELILRYGEQHPNEYGGRWLENQHHYGVAFSGSVDLHRVVLAAQLDLPERLQVRPCTYSYARLREVQTEIVEQEMKGSRVTVTKVGVDEKQNVLRVGVLPRHVDTEVRLRQRYGDLIVIEEGALAQPF